MHWNNGWGPLICSSKIPWWFKNALQASRLCRNVFLVSLRADPSRVDEGKGREAGNGGDWDMVKGGGGCASITTEKLPAFFTITLKSAQPPKAAHNKERGVYLYLIVHHRASCISAYQPFLPQNQTASHDFLFFQMDHHLKSSIRSAILLATGSWLLAQWVQFGSRGKKRKRKRNKNTTK